MIPCSSTVYRGTKEWRQVPKMVQKKKKMVQKKTSKKDGTKFTIKK